MFGKSISYAVLRAIVCVVFAMAVVLLPPSSAHAGHNMADNASVHGTHDMTSDASLVRVAVDHSSHSMLGDGCTKGHSKSADDATQNADQCCSGICLSAFIQQAQFAMSQDRGDGHDPLPLLRMVSGGATHFLRPPNV